jgi:hypothetical protein
MSEYFSIELKVSDRTNPLVQAFIGQFTGAMASDASVITGLPEIEVIACGWGDKCGSMTACDAYEAELRVLGVDPDEALQEFLETEGLL